MRLIRLLLKCIFPCKCCLPKIINDNECIVRCVYSTMNLKKNGSLQASFYRPPIIVEEDGTKKEGGISTVRRAYSRLNFIKHHCKCQEKPADKRSYYGMAYLLASNIRSCQSGNYKASIISTPTRYESYKLPQHADILYGYIPEKGSPLPTEINMIIEGLLSFTTMEKDNHPLEKDWRKHPNSKL